MDVDQHLQEFHHNQCVWLARLATGEVNPSAPHDRFVTDQGSIGVRTGDSGVVMLPFAGNLVQAIDAQRSILCWLRTMPIADVLLWNMHPNHEIDLAMLAQGFQVGFEPWWMTRDLGLSIAEPIHQISLANDSDIDQLCESQIPYVVPVQIESTRQLVEQNGDVKWLIARHDGRVIGQSILNLTGDHAGLFNVGVDGRFRHRGVGQSLTNAAMRIATEAGARNVQLNSTPMGLRMYERLGFKRIGTGLTWSGVGSVAKTAVSTELNDLVLAIGTGDIDAVDTICLPDAFPNGMTGQEIAARFRQNAMLRHLIALGQVPEIMSLWDSGLRDDALAATSHPSARELPSGSRRARPLHLAVERGAGSLVLALIRAGADLNARDGEYRATPLDWAHACNKPTIARILRQAGGE